MPFDSVPKPWRSFLRELDEAVTAPVRMVEVNAGDLQGADMKMRRRDPVRGEAFQA